MSRPEKLAPGNFELSPGIVVLSDGQLRGHAADSARPDEDLDVAGLAALPHVEAVQAELSRPERKRDLLLLPGLERHALEPLQLADRGRHAGRGVMDVELDNLVPNEPAGIRDGRGD